MLWQSVFYWGFLSRLCTEKWSRFFSFFQSIKFKTVCVCARASARESMVFSRLKSYLILFLQWQHLAVSFSDVFWLRLFSLALLVYNLRRPPPCNQKWKLMHLHWLAADINSKLLKDSDYYGVFSFVSRTHSALVSLLVFLTLTNSLQNGKKSAFNTLIESISIFAYLLVLSIPLSRHLFLFFDSVSSHSLSMKRVGAIHWDAILRVCVQCAQLVMSIVARQVIIFI